MIVWEDAMRTGLSDLDAQHKTIIDKFNQFSEAMSSADAREVAGSILDFLQFYAAWHFEREEKYMEQYKCPIDQANKQAHAKFLDKFGQFYEQWQTSNMDLDLVDDTYLELEKWIKNHILEVDIQLLPYVKK